MAAPCAKVVLLGDTGVGKTVLVERALSDAFSGGHIPTIGAQFVPLEVAVGGVRANLEVWDTAGQERYRSLIGFYARGARGALVLYDMTCARSFEQIPAWFEFARAQSPDVRCVLFGNKADLADARAVTADQGEAMAERLGAPFFEGSARTAENVREAFERVALLVAERPAALGPPAARQRRRACC
jgi:small GTP-binding protein